MFTEFSLSFSYSVACQHPGSSRVSDVNSKLSETDGPLSPQVIHAQKSTKDFMSTVILFWDSDIFQDKAAELSALDHISIKSHLNILSFTLLPFIIQDWF